MVINKIPFIGNGVIKPAIPEQNITSESYTEKIGGETFTFKRIKSVDLTGLSGEYTVPEYIDGIKVKQIGFNKNSNIGSVSHIIIPFPFVGYYEDSGFYDFKVFAKHPLRMTINAIVGYAGNYNDTISSSIFKDSLSQLNIVSYITQNVSPSYFNNEGSLQKCNFKKIYSTKTPDGNYASLIINDEYFLSGFSEIKGTFRQIRVDTLRLTQTSLISVNDAFRYGTFSTLYLDNYVGDASKSRRFADNSNLTTIYAPMMATVSDTDFSNCPNIAHIYTDSDNVQTLKDELTNKGYSGLVNLVEAI